MKIKCFGIAKEIISNSILEIENEQALKTVADLRAHLLNHYEDLKKYKSFMVAVNQSYASDETPINSSDEIAIIPPVSGG